MIKEYLVVSTGISKKTNNEYSIGKNIVTTKDGTQFISDKDTKYFDQILDIGNIVKINEEITF